MRSFVGADSRTRLEIFTTEWKDQLEIAVQVVIATVLGALIGIERELSHKPAGLRTHAILAAAAALLVGLTEAVVQRGTASVASDLIRADPIRIVEAIVTGVAFLGAGTIFRHREGDVIEGLTTAASLLLVAGIAIAVSLGQMLLALLVTAIGLLALRFSRIWSGAK